MQKLYHIFSVVTPDMRHKHAILKENVLFIKILFSIYTVDIDSAGESTDSHS